MGRHVSWVHGNALTVESPENIEATGRHFGWGADLVLLPGKGSWFHIPLPVPAIVNQQSVYLQRTFLLFETEGNAFLKNVHIYDANRVLQRFDNLPGVSGNFTINVVNSNTFVLSTPQKVRRGIGLSFFIQGTLPQPPGRPTENRLIVTAAGAEYLVGSSFLVDVAERFDSLIRG
jgi:hypothetical protein